KETYDKSDQRDWHYEQQLKSKKVDQPRRQKVQVEKHFEQFAIGDSVAIPSMKEKGIVYKAIDEFGNVIVMINGKKESLPAPRFKILLHASEPYPEN
ncbi:endonuclease MutS2, partial [Staphylococcus sp. SIMBA_130]